MYKIYGIHVEKLQSYIDNPRFVEKKFKEQHYGCYWKNQRKNISRSEKISGLSLHAH